jgi:hypothetical protein
MYNIKLTMSAPMSYREQTALTINIAKGKTFPVHTTKAEIFIHSPKLENHLNYWLKKEYHNIKTETYTNIHNI